MRLHPTAPHMPGETPASYASRLARLNGISSTVTFCGDFEIDLAGLFAGMAGPVGTLAEVAGVPVEILERDAWRQDDGPATFAPHRLRGQMMTRGGMRREGRRICAACMRDDVASSRLPRGAAAFYRAVWRVSHLRTCPIHRQALTELPPGNNTSAQCDLAGFLDPYLDRLDALADAQIRRDPSSLESYLLDRLEGRTGAAPWLDALPFYAAAKATEMMGAASMFEGRRQINQMGEADWHLAGQIGFEIVREGEEGLQRFLTELRTSRVKQTRGSKTASGYFGALYAWLAYHSPDCAFDPLRDAIRRNVVENTSVAPGTALFDRPLVPRPPSEGCAPREAARRLNIPDDLVDDLIHRGYLRTTAKWHTAGRWGVRLVTFEEMDRFRQTYVTLSEAARKRRLQDMTMWGRLAAAGILPAHQAPTSGVALYLREQVDGALGVRAT